jgi:hypothetical protein
MDAPFHNGIKHAKVAVRRPRARRAMFFANGVEETQITETQIRSRQCVLLLSDILMHCQTELNHVAVYGEGRLSTGTSPTGPYEVVGYLPLWGTQTLIR